MHITFICYWGMMCLVNGAFDLVRWIDQAVHSPVYPFSTSMPLSYNMVSLLTILVPISMLIGAPFAWRLYKHTTEGDFGFDAMGANSNRLGSERAPLWNARASQQQQVFGGSGN